MARLKTDKEGNRKHCDDNWPNLCGLARLLLFESKEGIKAKGLII